MARHKRSSALETRAARARLPVRRKPVFIAVGPRVGIGYRRNAGTGTWVARGADGAGGYWTKAFAIADDNEDANGETVLNFWQAQDKAKTMVRGKEGSGDRPVTVAEALENYAADLTSRGSGRDNAQRVVRCLPPSIAAKAVALLGAKELRHWRNGMGVKAASADRTARMLKAALNLAARDDPRITNSSAWKTGLARLPDAEPPANKIVSDDVVRTIVSFAYTMNGAYGLLVEIAAVTGARPSQLLRLEVADLHLNDGAPRLMMPSSRKGRRKRVDRRPLPIPVKLAASLAKAAEGRAPHARLLLRADGKPWGAQDHGFRFRRLVRELKLGSGVTFYSLRHSSIVRQLLAGIPARVVAAGHDTSVVMLEHTYSRYIGEHSDAMVRRSLIDL